MRKKLQKEQKMKEDSKNMTFIENKFMANYNKFNLKTDIRTDRKILMM